MFARHPNFVNWAYFFPFILSGIERYRNAGKKIGLIIPIFLNMVTSYYTFYVNMVLVVVYLLVTSVCEIIYPPKQNWKSEIKGIIRIGCVIAAGVLLASFCLLPTIYAFLHNPRLDEVTGYRASALHYPLSFYKRALLTIFTPFSSAGYTLFIGVPLIAILCVLSVFLHEKKYFRYKALIAVFFVLSGIPFFGRIVNGFGYATDRWSFVIPFFAGVLVTQIMTYLLPDLTWKQLSAAIGAGLFYIMLSCFSQRIKNDHLLRNTVMALAVVLAIVGIIFRCKKEWLRKTFVLISIAGASFQLICTFSSTFGGYVEEFLADAELESAYHDSSALVAAQLAGTTGPFRVESKESEVNLNGINHVYGTDIWWSMLPSYHLDYLNDFEVNDVIQNCKFLGLDGRNPLLELAAVKYYTIPEEDDPYVPFGYQRSSLLSTDEYDVYENMYALPMAYAFDDYMREDEYEQLHPVNKLEALLQTVVLEEPAGDFKEAVVRYGAFPVELELTGSSVFKQGQDSVVTEDRNEMISYSASIPECSDVYIRLPGINIESNDIAGIRATRMDDEGSSVITKRSRISNLDCNWPVIRDGITFGLGICAEGNTDVKVCFQDIGEYEYHGAELYVIPVTDYEQHLSRLCMNAAESVEAHEDQIRITTAYTEDKIVQIAIPFSDGWHASIDGEKTKLYKSDKMYMSVAVPEGRHEITLRYRTPFLLSGMIISLLTLAVIVIIWAAQYKRQKVTA